MTISVLTPDRTIFTGAVSSVTLPGTDGSFQLLDNHAPLVASLDAGRVKLLTAAGTFRYYDAEAEAMTDGDTAGRQLSFSIESGFVEVLNNEVNLLVQGARNVR